MAQNNPYIRLANVVDMLAPDAETQRTEQDNNVKLLMALLNERQAEICTNTVHDWLTVEQIAERGGYKAEDIADELYQAAIAGVLYVKDFDGVDKYKLSFWMPGILEHASHAISNGNVAAADAFYNQEPMATAMQYQAAPIGGGIMRAIPIREAVDAQAVLADHEQIKTYLDQSDIYSTCDCECRRSAQLAGESSIIPYKDAEIQVGEEAEYYIRTGRGRQITRQEAEEILERYERYGCVHQVFNNEGTNKTSIICNCDGDNCGVLRNLRWFNIPDHSKSNFTSHIDPEKCVACGACVEICPMNAIRMGNKFCDLDAQKPRWDRKPSEDLWTPADWNPDRHHRIMVNNDGTSPCKTQCPAHISIQGYIKKAGEGNYMDALRIIKRDNPFPAVCGRICPHTCENECSRARVDEAIAIDDIKKFIADKELEEGNRFIPEIYEHYDEKVAVIGGGPAGLTCAYYLAVEGYKVTVFDREALPGGMLRNGMPPFRLEKDIVDAEIDVLRQMGVEFACNTDVGKDVTIAELREQGFKAFYISIGAQKGLKLNVAGEELENVSSGIDFLRKVNKNQIESLDGKVLVIGGGNAAIDVARSAMRFTKAGVEMFCLEKDEEMPTVPDEKNEAIEEGIKINNCWGPKRILGENGKVTGVEFMRCLSVRDENGSFAPKYDENDVVIIPCDHVFVAIGQYVDWGELLKDTKADPAGKRVLAVEPITYQTAESDIFGGGDAAIGPQFTIDAIATGKSGAISIHRFLRGYNMTAERQREFKPFDKDKADFSSYEAMKRQRPKQVNFKEATETLHDMRSTLIEEQIAKEAKRCLGCGVSIVDPYMCIGCGLCYTKCEFDAIRLEKTRDVTPPSSMAAWGENIAANAAQLMQKIAVKTQATEGDVDSTGAVSRIPGVNVTE